MFSGDGSINQWGRNVNELSSRIRGREDVCLNDGGLMACTENYETDKLHITKLQT